MDLKVFRRACYDAAQRTSGKLSEFRISNELTPNFHQGVIAYADRTVAVACLRNVPLLALAVPRLIDSTPRDWTPLTFVDVPVLTAALAEATEFRLLTVTELAGAIDLALWPQISRHDIRYWKPKTLGEALFNYWD